MDRMDESEVSRGDDSPAGPSSTGQSPSPWQQVMGPVRAAERIREIDVIRGFALLGILMININVFALPQAAMDNPFVAGGTSRLDMLAWRISHLFFYEKFMSLFSMLFGAGLMLMAARAREAGKEDREFRRIYFRRSFWLMVFGFVHAYFLWFGDILFTYGVCGFLIYPWRNRRPRAQILAGAVALLVGGFMLLGASAQFSYLKDKHEKAEKILAEGGELSPGMQGKWEGWRGIQTAMRPSDEEIEREIEDHRGGFLDVFMARLPSSIMMQTTVLFTYAIWRAGGLMLVGMGLLGLGVLSGKRTTRFYGRMALLGYGVGIPIVEFGARQVLAREFELIYSFGIGSAFNYFGSLAVTLGHIGLVMLVVRSGAFSWLVRRLAAVGRMALTNYLFHSIVFTTIFYGYGLGLFARLSRAELVPLVAAMWIFQLIASPIWLSSFRFGPAEWLWRSLTYKSRPRMRYT